VRVPDLAYVPATVDRWSSKRPRIVRFDEEGHMSAAARAEQDAVPKASEAVLNLTGISRDMAPSPSGQLLYAFLLRGARGIPTSALIRLSSLRAIPRGAHLCREHSGDGTAFYRVRYELPRVGGRRQRATIYLGTNPAVAEWADGILAEQRWRASMFEPPAIDKARIAQLGRLRRRVASTAQQVARRAGYSLRGSRLLERRHG